MTVDNMKILDMSIKLSMVLYLGVCKYNSALFSVTLDFFFNCHGKYFFCTKLTCLHFKTKQRSKGAECKCFPYTSLILNMWAVALTGSSSL